MIMMEVKRGSLVAFNCGFVKSFYSGINDLLHVVTITAVAAAMIKLVDNMTRHGKKITCSIMVQHMCRHCSAPVTAAMLAVSANI